MKHYTNIFLLFLLMISCSKEVTQIITPIETPKEWEKFIGTYKVYDTLGSYLYEMEIKHYSAYQDANGNPFDSLYIKNFADKFDIKFSFREKTDKNVFTSVFTDSIVDQNGKTWGLWHTGDDYSTPIRENKLFNDTIILYFTMDNIKYYIYESQPYFSCDCKQVAIKTK
jgi:hypothetical protein